MDFDPNSEFVLISPGSPADVAIGVPVAVYEPLVIDGHKFPGAR